MNGRGKGRKYYERERETEIVLRLYYFGVGYTFL